MNIREKLFLETVDSGLVARELNLKLGNKLDKRIVENAIKDGKYNILKAVEAGLISREDAVKVMVDNQWTLEDAYKNTGFDSVFLHSGLDGKLSYGYFSDQDYIKNIRKGFEEKNEPLKIANSDLYSVLEDIEAEEAEKIDEGMASFIVYDLPDMFETVQFSDGKGNYTEPIKVTKEDKPSWFKRHPTATKIIAISAAAATLGTSLLGYLYLNRNKDSDHDGLSDRLEKKYHTDPNNPDTSGDGILDGKAIELGLNPTQAYPLVGYGYEKGLEDAVLKELVNVSNNQSTHAFVDYLTRLDNTSALYLVQHFLEDKKLNETESNQIKFLSSLKKIPSLISKLINFDWEPDGLKNYEEEKLGTNYTNNDSDGDGILDGKEVKIYHTNPLKKDSDNDGLDDDLEITLGTNPNNPDTDGDGLNDNDEVNVYHTNPLKKDSDGDNYTDLEEIVAGSNPLDKKSIPGDTDSDGLNDAWELKYFGNLNQKSSDDPDRDNLTNIKEQQYDTNPLKKDTSGDGISDGKAVELGLNPTIKYNSSFVTLLSKLNYNEQKEFIRKFVENNVSRRGLEQAIFLNSLPSKDFQYFRNHNLITNEDPDRDDMSSFFEKFKMKLPWNTTNNRYFIYVSTSANPLNLSNNYILPFEPMDPWGNIWDQQRYILYKYKFDPSKVYSLLEKNATFGNFSDIISNLANATTYNDIIYIYLNMDGRPGRLYFSDRSITTPKLNEELNKLYVNRIVLGIRACSSTMNETLNPLANGTSPRVVMGGEDILLYATLAGSWGYIFNRYLDIMDENKDHRISIEESFNYKYNAGLRDFRDTNKLFDTTFLGDATTEELHVDVPPQP